MRPRPSETRGLQSFAVRFMGFCLCSCAHWPHLCCQQICAHLPFACCPLLPVCWSVCSVLHAPCAFSSPTPCSAYYTPLTCPALYSLTALCLFLPAPSCGHYILGFCHPWYIHCPTKYLLVWQVGLLLPHTLIMRCLLTSKLSSD